MCSKAITLTITCLNSPSKNWYIDVEYTNKFEIVSKIDMTINMI